ncbi:hypothetical protein [Sorangium sp. So ce1182]|uniref:hypothetical protein n=1 Tax=Sorangium sp. So ce1182 TaxID=3133334 RepID=UPI003F60BEBF
MRRSNALSLAIAATLVLGALTIARDAPAETCAGMKLHKKDPIPFRPFEMKKPSSGEGYLPNEEIEIAPGKKMLARDFFKQVNDLEAKLNQWGYSLHDGGASTLGELDMCMELLRTQVGAIDRDVKDHGPTLWSPERYAKQVDEAWKKYQAQVPSWDDLYKKADDAKVKVYLPDKPVLSPPASPSRHPDLKPLFKEKTWSTEVGSKSTLWVSPSATLSVTASKTDADVKATGKVLGAFLGVWDGEIVAASAEGKTLGTDQGSLNITVSVVGNTVFSPSWTEKGLNRKDKKEYSADEGVDYRFAIGPIPMRARVGFTGAVGLQYGFQILPLQVIAYAQPYADTKMYAQVGADIGIAGAGVGGEVTLIKDSFTVQGSTLVKLEDEPTLVVELSGDNEMMALCGRLYFYAYFDYWIDKAKLNFDIWDWDGVDAKANMFDYRWTWTPSGAAVDGKNLSAEDVMEVNAANEDIRLTQIENNTSQHVHDVMTAVAADVNSTHAARVLTEHAKENALSEALDVAVQQYWTEVVKWTTP